MRIAVMSDIHGNSSALDAVLGDIDRRGIDTVVNLGDSVSGPLDPGGTASRLLERDIPSISGNHDRWLYDPPEGGAPLWEVWTAPFLAPPHMGWIRGLPPRLVIEGMLLTHGTPASDFENWLHRRAPDGTLREATLAEAEAPAIGEDFPVILSGHTHMPRIVRLPDGRLLANPGSVGCPAYRDTRHDPPRIAEAGAPDARYAILERAGAHWQASLLAIPYDPEPMIDRANDLGADGWAYALRFGWAPR
jgi:predicted phosphodiesterase